MEEISSSCTAAGRGRWSKRYPIFACIGLALFFFLWSEVSWMEELGMTNGIVVNCVTTTPETSIATKHSSSEAKNSATGSLFSGERVRTYVRRASGNKRPSASWPQSKDECQSKYWAVVTTINDETEAVRKISAIEGWCVVVVGDLVGPKSYPPRPNYVFLNPDAQRVLAELSPFVENTPWRHFGRKNIGYLYAIRHGAEMIFDFDDDNEVFQDPRAMLQQGKICVPDDSFLTYNPYPELNPSVEGSPWPRGLPLEEYQNDAVTRDCVRSAENTLKSAIYQFAANHDPDVDAVYRLTRKIPFSFESTDKHIAFPKKVFVPYNAQANVHLRDAFWALLLPTTVQGRVSDIWRGYAAQRLMWDHDLGLVYTSPVVQQFRNAHNYLADFQAELDLYHRSGVLLQFLISWTCTDELPICLEKLWIDLYERAYIELDDVLLLQAWIAELDVANYEWPARSHTKHRSLKWQPKKTRH